MLVGVDLFFFMRVLIGSGVFRSFLFPGPSV
jgi:hypothetical protein